MDSEPSSSTPADPAPVMHEPTHEPTIASSSRNVSDENIAASAPPSNIPTETTMAPPQIQAHTPNSARVTFQSHPVKMVSINQADSFEAQQLALKPFSQRWANAKNWINFALLNINTVIIILSTYLNTDNSVGYSFGIMAVSWICLGICSLSIIWTSSELLVVMYRGQRNPIHPGAHVGVHLIICILAVLATGSLTTYWVFGFFDDNYSSYLSGISSDTTLTTANLSQLDTDDLIVLLMRRRATRIGRTLTVAMWAVMITHLVLFVRACVETNHLRRFRRIIYIVQQPAQQQSVPTMAGAQVQQSGPTTISTQALDHAEPIDEKQQFEDPTLHGYYAPTAAPPSCTVGHTM